MFNHCCGLVTDFSSCPILAIDVCTFWTCIKRWQISNDHLVVKRVACDFLSVGGKSRLSPVQTNVREEVGREAWGWGEVSARGEGEEIRGGPDLLVLFGPKGRWGRSVGEEMRNSVFLKSTYVTGAQIPIFRFHPPSSATRTLSPTPSLRKAGELA